MDAPSAAADEDYEICNDDGFVYKRHRGLCPDAAPTSAQLAGPNPEAIRRRRRDALLRLRGRRLRELERWEALEGKLLAPLPAPRPPPPSSSDLSAAADTSASASVLDDLLAQAEVEEAILIKVAGLCDALDSLCRMHEEDIVDAITALPVWGDPKELVTTLQGLDALGDLNLIKDYKNEGNGGFQRLDNRHGRRAIEEGGHDRCQEVAEVSPKTVHIIKESDKKMKRGHLQRRTPAGVDDDTSLLTEKQKKKVSVSPSSTRSAKKSRFYQSSSPNPVSFSWGPKTRRAAAAKKE